MQPGALLAGSEADVGLGPLARPVILLAVEAGGAHPVLQGEIVAVADAQAPLLGRIDEHQAAERPERLAAERLLRLLVEQDHALAGVDQLAGRNQPRQAAADHDHVRIHCSLPAPLDGGCVHTTARSTCSGVNAGDPAPAASACRTKPHDTLGERSGNAMLLRQRQDRALQVADLGRPVAMKVLPHGRARLRVDRQHAPRHAPEQPVRQPQDARDQAAAQRLRCGRV